MIYDRYHCNNAYFNFVIITVQDCYLFPIVPIVTLSGGAYCLYSCPFVFRLRLSSICLRLSDTIEIWSLNCFYTPCYFNNIKTYCEVNFDFVFVKNNQYGIFIFHTRSKYLPTNLVQFIHNHLRKTICRYLFTDLFFNKNCIT